MGKQSKKYVVSVDKFTIVFYDSWLQMIFPFNDGKIYHKQLKGKSNLFMVKISLSLAFKWSIAKHFMCVSMMSG